MIVGAILYHSLLLFNAGAYRRAGCGRIFLAQFGLEMLRLSIYAWALSHPDAVGNTQNYVLIKQAVELLTLIFYAWVISILTGCEGRVVTISVALYFIGGIDDIVTFLNSDFAGRTDVLEASLRELRMIIYWGLAVWGAAQRTRLFTKWSRLLRPRFNFSLSQLYLVNMITFLAFMLIAARIGGPHYYSVVRSLAFVQQAAATLVWFAKRGNR